MIVFLSFDNNNLETNYLKSEYKKYILKKNESIPLYTLEDNIISPGEKKLIDLKVTCTIINLDTYNRILKKQLIPKDANYLSKNLFVLNMNQIDNVTLISPIQILNSGHTIKITVYNYGDTLAIIPKYYKLFNIFAKIPFNNKINPIKLKIVYRDDIAFDQIYRMPIYENLHLINSNNYSFYIFNHYTGEYYNNDTNDVFRDIHLYSPRTILIPPGQTVTIDLGISVCLIKCNRTILESIPFITIGHPYLFDCKKIISNPNLYLSESETPFKRIKMKFQNFNFNKMATIISHTCIGYLLHPSFYYTKSKVVTNMENIFDFASRDLRICT